MKKINVLTPEEEAIIVRKGTEPSGTGAYLHHYADGVYACRCCNAGLFSSADKFDSGCGWPAFDDALPGAVARTPDVDGERVEITCAVCGGHLGHVFDGEGMTLKNTRHCVNSLSLKFVAEGDEFEKAYFAAGCFWNVEHWFEREPGVVGVRIGFMGGSVKDPADGDVRPGHAGRAEVVEVRYDPAATNYEKLLLLFFEIHDFSRLDRGPDHGARCRSALFPVDAEQEETARRIASLLSGKDMKPATRIEAVNAFCPAGERHREQYARSGECPFCHTRRSVGR